MTVTSTTSLPNADSKRHYYLNLLELIGASGLALFSVASLVVSVQYLFVNAQLDALGLVERGELGATGRDTGRLDVGRVPNGEWYYTR